MSRNAHPIDRDAHLMSRDAHLTGRDPISRVGASHLTGRDGPYDRPGGPSDGRECLSLGPQRLSHSRVDGSAHEWLET